MLDDFDDDVSGEIRARSAAVNYDGSLKVLLDVPGVEDPVEHTLRGDQYTVLMNHDERHPLPVDLAGTSAADRRCQALVARGVARLNEDLARKRRQQERLHREHLAQEEERYVG